MSEAEPGAGDIEIELDGAQLVMRPTASACLAISRLGGGLNAAVQRCLQLDMDTIIAVIQAGCGFNPTQAKKLPEAVYNTGLFRLSPACIDFINVVGNGGRPLPEDDTGDGDDADPLTPPSP